jgi:hypothetical protein
MKLKQLLNYLLTMVITLCALVNVQALDIKQTGSKLSAENVILQWNRVLKETITWDGTGGAMRLYIGFTAMANEEERSCVWGGIHFTFDQAAGQSAGRNIANYVYQNIMRPRKCVL